ncbi:hypothetical protein Moror_6804 [Moniliophthora roreri MCA 2997]|uniref:Uncharacterized protein n=1 Tax=Moniliophthora roreri (strain MCA 2997) TaxID=1381753 RepID=V2YXZ3_MONRO|nr:hypothetical protein Moror_6804 [Moniliophthora roreri MCA 2997]
MNKTYVDQAVQTEPPRQFSRSNKSLNIHHDPNPVAYNGPTRSQKPSQMQYTKPSQLNTATKRVVSLPESSPPFRLKPTGDRYRVASMSEAVKVSLAADDSLSSDCLESSLSVDSSHSSLRKIVSQPHSSLHNSSFPRTPSPPSSPESSIVIIGNNVEVSHSFLRPQPQYDFEEEHCWNTWASSPPRPIPALHGPLSLPYARCPSGAEGTLVEGEDLSRMIWGLREDEAVTCVPRNDSPPENDSQERFLSDQLVLSRHQQQFTTSSLVSSSPSMPSHRHFSTLHTPPELPVPRTTYENRRDDSPIIIPPTTQQLENFLEIHRVLEPVGSKRVVPNTGLGLVWQLSHARLSSPQVSDSSPLQASTPAFIPTRSLQHPESQRTNPESNHASISRDKPAAAIELATEYMMQQKARNSLLTPPNSSSTTWSPCFADMAHPKFLYVPEEPFSFEELCGSVYVDKDIISNHQLQRPLESPHLPPRFTNSSSLRRPLHSVNPSNISIDQVPANKAPPSPESPEVKGTTTRLGAQHPRSVPFARLLQRRLSAVPEEAEPVSTNLAARATQSRRTGFQNGAQAPNKPYFAQAIHNHPDATNKPASNPAPSISNPGSLEHRIPRSVSEMPTFNPPKRLNIDTTLSIPLHQQVDDVSIDKCGSKENTSSSKVGDKTNAAVRRRGRNRPKKVTSKGETTT